MYIPELKVERIDFDLNAKFICNFCSKEKAENKTRPFFELFLLNYVEICEIIVGNETAAVIRHAVFVDRTVKIDVGKARAVAVCPVKKRGQAENRVVTPLPVYEFVVIYLFGIQKLRPHRESEKVVSFKKIDETEFINREHEIF